MGKRRETEFQRYYESLLPEEQQWLNSFFDCISQRLDLPNKQKKSLLNDYQQAFLLYARIGVSLSDAVRRLDPAKLGDFYSRRQIDWYPLDSAGCVYPLSMDHSWMAVFRLSLYFRQPIHPVLLQMALNFTVRRFPTFAAVLRRGFFWNYLETAPQRYAIERERNVPCSRLHISGNGAPCLRVIYYANRLSVEFFHVLTDGSGGSIFIQTLAAEYLRLLGHSVPVGGQVLDLLELPTADEAEDAFLQADPQQKPPSLNEPSALQLNGKLCRGHLCRVLHFDLNAAALHQAAKAKGCTVTAYILTCLFLASKEASSGSGILKIQMPVNMRRYYPSATLRNFSLFGILRIPRDLILDFDSVLPMVKSQMKRALDEDTLRESMALPAYTVKQVRWIPLFLKRPCARLLYRKMGDMTISNTLSNLGLVRLSPQMAEHIEKMDFVLGTVMHNRAACSMVTVGDHAILTASKLTKDTSFEKSLLRVLEEQGLQAEVSGSPIYG